MHSCEAYLIFFGEAAAAVGILYRSRPPCESGQKSCPPGRKVNTPGMAGVQVCIDLVADCGWKLATLSSDGPILSSSPHSWAKGGHASKTDRRIAPPRLGVDET